MRDAGSLRAELDRLGLADWSTRRVARVLLAARDEKTLRNWLGDDETPERVLNWLRSVESVREDGKAITIRLRA